MPELEKLIAEWRAEMLAAGIPDDAAIELEFHLRDDIARQTLAGGESHIVFETAVQRLGRPASLQKEFNKLARLGRITARAKNAVLSFAGIPSRYAQIDQSPSPVDSRWATYFRAVVFLLPAVALWTLAATYVTPAFTEIWEQVRNNQKAPADLARLLRLDLDIMNLLKDNLWMSALACVLALGLLEWRSKRWPRYRRAVIGSGVFLVNFAVLFNLALLFLAATFAAREFTAAAIH